MTQLATVALTTEEELVEDGPPCTHLKCHYNSSNNSNNINRRLLPFHDEEVEEVE